MLVVPKLVPSLAGTILFSAGLLAQGDSSCLRRTAVVSVVTRKNLAPVTGLTAASFRAQFRGKPVRILSAAKDDRPNRVVILLDTSGSMSGVAGGPPVKLAVSRRLALGLVSFVPANSALAFLAFSDNVGEQAGFDRTRQQIREKITLLGTTDHPAAKGRTAFRDAIMAALRLLDPPGPEDMIYLLTDGGDNASKASEGKLKKALRSSGVRLYSIAVLPDLFPVTPEELAGPNVLAALTEFTGGTVVSYLKEDLSKEGGMRSQVIVKDLVNRVAESYRVEFELPQAPEKKQSWKLELVDIPKVKGRIRVLYPRDLLPCAEVTPKN